MNTPYRSASAEKYPGPTADKAIANAMRAGRMTVDEYKRLAPGKSAKYRNKKTVTVDGEFDSQKEANRFTQLRALQCAGRITGLKRQVRFEIIPEQRNASGELIEQAAHYVADFTYTENGALVVEDVKSSATRKIPAYVLKRKLMLAMHGVRIREV